MTEESLTGPLAPEDVTSDSLFTLPGFFDALAEGQLLAARCMDCGTHLMPPRPACYGCGSRAVEIEEQPPDAELSDHLEHLRAELDDPDSRRELDRLEAVVAETEDGTELPSRCPEQHCDAAWSERGIVGARTGRYERLDDDRVLCLECETVHTID